MAGKSLAPKTENDYRIVCFLDTIRKGHIQIHKGCGSTHKTASSSQIKSKQGEDRARISTLTEDILAIDGC